MVSICEFGIVIEWGAVVALVFVNRNVFRFGVDAPAFCPP